MPKCSSWILHLMYAFGSTCANQRLKGAAFFEGIDCTNRNTLCKSYIWQSAVFHL